MQSPRLPMYPLRAEQVHHWFVDFANRTDYLPCKRDLQERQLIKRGAHLAELLSSIRP
jgi:hypothetical protein